MKLILNYFQMHTFVCFVSETTEKFQWYIVGQSISSIFLVATLVVYGFIPKVFIYKIIYKFNL